MAVLDPADRGLLQTDVNLLEFSPHTPTPKQVELVDDDSKEIFFGGRAGGGKSDGLLMAALKYVHVPQYCALIVRKSFADLNKPGAIMDRAIEWFRPRGVRWDGQNHVMTFPSGARFSFGHLDHAGAHINYQGGEYQFIGIDEVPHIPEYQYRYLFSRLRRVESLDLPLRMRSTGNPGGLPWVKERFVTPTTRRTGARFIESGIADNPFLGSDYAASLDELDPVTRAQLRDGDWDITATGNTFKRDWFRVVDALPDHCAPGTRRWDMAATEPRKGYSDPDYTASVLMIEHRGVIYLAHATRDRRGPAETIAIMRSQAEADGPAVRIRVEREPGSASIREADNLARTTFAGFQFAAVPSLGDKLARARPLSAAIEQGRVVLVRGDWNQWFIDELCLFPTAGVHDDAVDAATGCYHDITGPTATVLQLQTSGARTTSGLGARERPRFGTF